MDTIFAKDLEDVDKVIDAIYELTTKMQETVESNQDPDHDDLIMARRPLEYARNCGDVEEKLMLLSMARPALARLGLSQPTPEEQLARLAANMGINPDYALPYLQGLDLVVEYTHSQESTDRSDAEQPKNETVKEIHQ